MYFVMAFLHELFDVWVGDVFVFQVGIETPTLRDIPMVFITFQAFQCIVEDFHPDVFWKPLLSIPADVFDASYDCASYIGCC